MPQSVNGSGCIPLKPGNRAKVAKLAEPLNGWLDWSEFALNEDQLTYVYGDIVTIGTAGDLEDFLEEIAANYASAGWAHYGEREDDIYYFGPSEPAKLEAEIAEIQRRNRLIQEALINATAKLATLSTQTAP